MAGLTFSNRPARAVHLIRGETAMDTRAVTALLIEDNPDDAALIERYLKHAGNIGGGVLAWHLPVVCGPTLSRARS
jgi:hypothetical protein